jgi:Cobalamin-independent synthase, Catalytic domain
VDAQLGGVATGVGSLPGTDIDAAWATTFEELPDLPHIPELPNRGPGADMIGRTAAQLAELAVDRTPSGWRLVPRPGGDQRVARELLTGDLDAVLPVAGLGYDGALKLQLVGPWTLAAALELPRGGRALRDSGAIRDIVASLVETVSEHLAEVARRVPNARLVLQLDEPGLPAVLAGQIPTESGFGRIRVPEASDVVASLKAVIDAAGVPVAIHCCSPDIPVRLLRETGAAVIGIDTTLGEVDRDAVGEFVDSGGVLWLGVLPALGPGIPPTPREVADPVRRLWHELGFAPELLSTAVAVTPACGLAGASPGWVKTAYRVLRQVSQALVEAPEGVGT